MKNKDKVKKPKKTKNSEGVNKAKEFSVGLVKDMCEILSGKVFKMDFHSTEIPLDTKLKKIKDVGFFIISPKKIYIARGYVNSVEDIVEVENSEEVETSPLDMISRLEVVFDSEVYESFKDIKYYCVSVVSENIEWPSYIIRNEDLEDRDMNSFLSDFNDRFYEDPEEVLKEVKVLNKKENHIYGFCPISSLNRIMVVNMDKELSENITSFFNKRGTLLKLSNFQTQIMVALEKLEITKDKAVGAAFLYLDGYITLLGWKKDNEGVQMFVKGVSVGAHPTQEELNKSIRVLLSEWTKRCRLQQRVQPDKIGIWYKAMSYKDSEKLGKSIKDVTSGKIPNITELKFGELFYERISCNIAEEKDEIFKMSLL